jgi:hypothetical protein
MKYILVIIILLLSPVSSKAGEAIGVIESQSGAGLLVRKTYNITTHPGLEIEMGDVIKTSDSIINIIFTDHTKVHVAKNSILEIDTFIYNTENYINSKVILKVVIGTIEYISGLIAVKNTEAVKITTPSASIATRGTIFSSTVNSLGESKITLLPDSEGKIGILHITNNNELFILDEAYETIIIK